MEADNSLSLVSFAELLDDIVCLLDFIRRLKNEKDQTALDKNQIEKLKLQLKSMWTSIQLSYSNLDGLSAGMSNETQHLEDLLKSIFMGIDMTCWLNTTWISSSESTKQYKGFPWLKLNGCIEHKIVEYVLPQIQLMAERVGYFNLEFLNTLGPSPVMLAHLLVKIIPVALEFMHVCSADLKASKSAEVGRFIKQLLEASPDLLREYLIHLQEHMVNVITASTSARNLHVMIEFLLIILIDMPKDIIHHDKLFDLIARVGALTREVASLVLNLEEKSRNEANTNESNITTLDLQENIELLKEDLKRFYLKVPSLSQLCFPMSDGPLFMNLLLINLNDLLNSNSYSVALIKEEIALVKEYLELIRSFFVNVEQELYKDHWIHALNVAYEAEHAINSILVRDHGLLHLIFLLPDIIEKIKIIKEEVFNLSKKIPKNMSHIVVNSPNKPVVRNSAIANQVIVGFEEERDWIIRKLISGPAEIDVISIIGMAGLGKTTLAYRVYNDESVVSHFDILAWCTVDQEHHERKLLQKIVNQVTGSNEKFNEDIDVADELRRKLYGRRYLIVLTYGILQHGMSKATKERFFHSIGSSALSCASDDLMPRRISVSFHYSLLEQNHTEKKKVSGKYLLSLKADHTDWPPFGLLVDKTAVLVHLRDLRLLRVLDIAQVFVEDSLLNEIGLLVHLRYLHIGMNVKALPSSLSNLWNLETLVVHNSRSTMVLLPVIWNLAKLRHISIYYCSFFDLDTDEQILLVEDSNSKLENLRILEQLKISYSKDTEDIFKRFPNVHKLDCEIVESWNSSAKCNWFPQLDVLNQLEEINARHRRLDSQFPKATKDFCFPSSLKRLTLEEFYLSSDSLSKIAILPNLQKLTLNRTMIQEEEWNVVEEEDTFKNLKYLELYMVRLSKWHVGEESFPVLEQLILAECNRLEEIPSSFGDITSLSRIKLSANKNLGIQLHFGPTHQY
ncbi:putative late blight resistance protein -like r1b-8 [Nicotiana attenuata]|uniref:Late blight resistance protein -like r1b-8 n=1 Tax=Nicotiana attenuata TaxID=49451 RepID=A0A1J6JYJ4_NICAT|nr:putative late blight resistance protein -like r1b-8 [Nicotiana attenuata]